MTMLDRAILIATCLFSYGAYVNSLEAHRHSHELACAVGHGPLCTFHKER